MKIRNNMERRMSFEGSMGWKIVGGGGGIEEAKSLIFVFNFRYILNMTDSVLLPTTPPAWCTGNSSHM